MRYLIAPFGSAGDHHPMIALGVRLRQRGHAVAVLANTHFQKAVEEAGLELLELGRAEEYLAALDHPDIWHPTRGLRAVFQPAMADALHRQYQAIAEEASRGPIAVVAGSIALGARLAQEKLGVPVVTIHLQPAIIRSIVAPPGTPHGPIPAWLPRGLVRALFWMVDRWYVDPVVGPRLDPMREQLGLPPIRRYFKDWMHSPLRVIGLFPSWYASAPDWPAQLRQTGFPLYDQGEADPLPSAVETFLDAGEPPVVVTFGSAMRQGEAPFRAAAEGLAQLGRRGLLLTPFREQIPAALPAGVAHFDYVPFRRLLPRAAALVHHGGIGTAAQGLAAGVPQLIMPLGHDQPDNAWRLRALGVARVLLPKRFTPPAVARELHTLLTDSRIAAACRAAAARFIGHDPIEQSCELIEEAVGR